MGRPRKSEGDVQISVIKDIALNYARNGVKSEQLMKKHGIDKSTIMRITTNMRALGVDIPRLKRGGIYLAAVDQLRKEHPEIIKDTKKR